MLHCREVQVGSEVGLDLLDDKPLKAFHGYWSEGCWREIVHTVWVWLLRHRSDGGTLEGSGHPSLAKGDVKYLCRYVAIMI